MTEPNTLFGISLTPVSDTGTDNVEHLCRGADNFSPSLPRYARLPINRCNLPAVILGGLSFQQQPSELALDGVAELHADLFHRLDAIDTQPQRAEAFSDYLTVHFCLEHLETAGLTARSKKRAKANWRRVLRGWSFDSDGLEGAVLKGWVESRFGLLPRFHGQPLRDFSGPAYLHYQEMRATGLYGTNALESQLDLVYAYSQYEFRRQALTTSQGEHHVDLYRGVNRLAEHEVLSKAGRQQTVLFNNIVSFTSSRERAGEFGDYILCARIPTAKVYFHHALIPGVLTGEREYLVIGGVHEVSMSTF